MDDAAAPSAAFWIMTRCDMVVMKGILMMTEEGEGGREGGKERGKEQ